MKKKINWFVVFFIVSIIFPILVHVCFYFTAPTDWLVAKWGAGEILAYVGTVSLGLVTVWQNERFKVENDKVQAQLKAENDKAQARMENIAIKANELAIISKIIEHENTCLSQIKVKFHDFMGMCSTQSILGEFLDWSNQESSYRDIYIGIRIENRKEQIKLASISFLDEFIAYPYNPDDNIGKLKKIVFDYSQYSIKYAEFLYDNIGSENEVSSLDLLHEKSLIEKNLVIGFEQFISEREGLLNKIIFEELTLNQIRKLYGQNFDEE